MRSKEEGNSETQLIRHKILRCAQNDREGKFAQNDKKRKFAQYAFNKSHATCYAWVSYQTGCARRGKRRGHFTFHF